MVTADYIDVLRGTADWAGLDRDNLSTQQQSILRNLLNKRQQYAWRYAKWPELCRLEKRYFRDVYAAATAYVAGNEVYFPQTQFCYQALTATTGNPPANAAGTLDATRWGLCSPRRSETNYLSTATYTAGSIVFSPDNDAFYQAIATSTGVAVTDTSKWGLLNDFSTYVALEQTGKTAIGTVWDVWDIDRRANAMAVKVDWFRSNLGIQVVSDLPLVWVEYRLRVPQLSGDTFDTTVTYAVGDQIYYIAGGNIYKCVSATVAGESPDTAPTKWEQVEIPYDFKEYLELAAAADYLAFDDDTTSDRYRGMAEQKLADVTLVLLGQEGQTQRTEVLTR